MNNLFIISFVVILFLAFLKDWPKMRSEKASEKFLYGLISLSSLVLLICWQFHINVPMPTHFFTQIVSPWIHRLIGI
jgi:hypothetical protein